MDRQDVAENRQLFGHYQVTTTISRVPPLSVRRAILRRLPDGREQGRDAQSRQAFLRLLELDPNNTSAMNNFSVMEAWFGRLDDAAYWSRRAFGLSGKLGNDFYHLVVPLLSIRADAESRRLLEEAERRFPAFHRVQILLSLLELCAGQLDRAASRTKELMGGSPQIEEVKIHYADIAFLLDAPNLEAAHESLMQQSPAASTTVAETIRLRNAYALAKRGEAAKAAALVAEAERVARAHIDAGNENPELQIELAAAALLRQDRNAALDWFARAVEGGYPEYGQIERDPILAQLKSEPRYRELLDRMKSAARPRRERGLLDASNLLEPAK